MKLSLKIPPLALGISALFLIWVVDLYIPFYQIDFSHQSFVASVISGAGLIIAVLGILAFRKLKTTVDPRFPEKANKLAITGIYKYSRNPMYLGMLLALLGFAIFLGSMPGIFISVLFVLFINKFQIHPEEIVLRKKFGEDYVDYTKQVRRWV